MDRQISTVERRRIILEELHRDKQVSTSRLSEIFRVSVVTLRKDLKYLERKKLLIRSRGGAMLPVRVGYDLPVEKRKILNLAHKRIIAREAASVIKQGDTVILDSGTTIMELAGRMKDVVDLTVITNALDIVMKLSGSDNVKIIVPGGIFRKKSFSLIGVNAVENFRMYKADKYFLSADGMTKEGVFTSNLEEGQIAKLIMSNARENIILMDSGKFGRMGIINFAPLTKIHMLITDKEIPQEYHKMLVEAGIRVIIAEEE